VIILTIERWKHITDRHPDLADSRGQVIGAIANPDESYIDADGLTHALKRVDDRYLVVIYSKTGTDELIRTAYYTSLKRKRRRYRKFTRLKPS